MVNKGLFATSYLKVDTLDVTVIACGCGLYSLTNQNWPLQ